MHKDTTQSEHHERIQNLIEAKRDRNRTAPHGVGGEEGVRPGAEFHKLHPGQAKPKLPFVSVTMLKRESEPFSGQEEGGLGWLQTLWPPNFV